MANDSFQGVYGTDYEVTNATEPANGTTTIEADGSITYTPNPDFNGTDTYEYTVTVTNADGTTTTETTTVTVTVDPVADILADAATTSEDAPVTTDVLANDSFQGVYGTDYEVTNATTPANGTTTIEADGSITYTPNPDFNGTDTYEYTVTVTNADGTTTTETTTVTVTVDPVADILADAATTSEDAPVTTDVLANDSFQGVYGTDYEVTNATEPANGTTTIEADGSITYTPNPDFNGTDTYEYTVTVTNADGTTTTETTTVTVTVDPVADILADAATTSEDAPVTTDVLANDSFQGVYGTDYEVTNATEPANGTTTIEADGSITYTPNPDFNGTDTYEYTVTVTNADGTTTTETTTVTVTVDPVADILADAATTSEDAPVTTDVLANDSFQGVYGTDYEVTNATEPANGTTTIEADGSITYTPNPDFNGTDTYEYTVTVTNADGTTTTETTTVTVTVDPVADILADAATTSEDAPVTTDVLANDSFQGVYGTDYEVTNATEPANGTTTIEADGSITYTPNPDFNGTDTYEYTVTVTNADGTTTTETTTVTVTVDPVADILADAATTSEDAPVTTDVLANDSFQGVYGTDYEVTNATEPANGTTTIEADGSITYTPNPDFNGTDTYEYTVTVTNADGTTTTETTTVTVTVDPVADVVDDSDVTNINISVTTDVLANDNFEGTNNVITSATNGSNGTTVVNADGTITYTPDTDFKGLDTYQYTVTVYNSDGTMTPETATVTITIGSINIVKEFTESSVTAGGPASSFTLVVTNDGSAPLSNISVLDDVDDRLMVTSVSSTSGVDDDSDGDAQTVEWAIQAIAPGTSETITVNFVVDSSTEEANGVGALNDESNVPNLAEASAVATENNSITVNDVDEDSIDILVEINLIIVKTFDPTQVEQGTYQSFTIEVTNEGPSDAVDVLVTDLVDSPLEVTNVNVTSGTGECLASAGQQVDCIVQLPSGESATVTVDYLASPFLNEGSSPYGTGIGDDFYFVFLNGSILEGSTDGGPVFLDGVDITANVTILTSLTRNDIVFDPPGPDPAFELHLSCSDPFTGGWGQSGGPTLGVDNNWQIGFFTIGRYGPQGFLKSCGNVVIPFDVPNIAYASGEDSFGSNTVNDNANVEIGPGITLDRVQTNGKRMTARLTNLTGDDKIISEISVIWPTRNGNLTKVWLTQYGASNTVWQGNDAPSDALLNSSLSSWNGGTLLSGEAILRFDFKKKVQKYGYVIRVFFTDGTWLDINVSDEPGSKESELSKVSNQTYFKAYPVPFEDELTIEYRFDYDTDVTIDVFDTKGALVKTNKKHNYRSGSNEKLKLDFSRHENQLYFVQIGTNREQIVKKVIRNGK
ncbi:protein of unknown function DUF11 [Flavobacteriaceae bacterium MAR_2010_188]|nr:protein of unknown function DUF11 [Flavobacteriaceae bacterium MAR_2010_188]